MKIPKNLDLAMDYLELVNSYSSPASLSFESVFISLLDCPEDIKKHYHLNNSLPDSLSLKNNLLSKKILEKILLNKKVELYISFKNGELL